jgi:hypothetical protein
MSTAEQYRAKSGKTQGSSHDTRRSRNEMSEIRDLEQAYTTHAESEEWMTVHIDRSAQQRRSHDNRAALAKGRRAHF